MARGDKRNQEVNRFMLGLFSGIAGGVIVGLLIQETINKEVAKFKEEIYRSPIGRLIAPVTGASGIADIMSPESHWNQWSADRTPRMTERLR